ncbi:MAG TPA: DUF5682 family protein [Gemmatimonadaceae bacterium]|nr:DUF5682 family protein [Gemmatimonadaceae bacterium]
MSESGIRVFGIRHHGPGSARSLAAALDALEPDLVLIEGPPDADDLIALAGSAGMVPPVALLLYAPDEPRRAHYYPFAVFSPEWIAIQHALRRKVPVRFMDLPAAHALAMDIEDEKAAQAAEAVRSESDAEAGPSSARRVRQDPLHDVARAAGYNDSERWWEHVVEERQDHTGAFDAVLEVMTALREDETHDPPPTASPDEARDRLREQRREAWMRRTIRSAVRDGARNVAIVCGAWHAPALLADVPVKEDDAVLKGMPKIAVKATWIPWTPDRLARESGYGAGIESPGWYAHVWEHGATPEASLSWMTRVSRMLREEGIDASPAQTIDAVRLASTLAALRGRPVPGLPELTESTLSALLDGNEVPLALLRKRLTIGDTLGTVPKDAPSVPLQEAIARDQKRLRMSPQASEKVLELDLRKPFDLERSVLLHRLRVLGIEWGTAERGVGKGTFKEVWRIAWRPELAVAVIEAAVWGNTVEEATAARAGDRILKAQDLPTLAALLGVLLLADVPRAARLAITRLDELAALSSDFAELCGALPPVARTLRYGDVRGTDSELLTHVVAGLVTRVSAGLPVACGSLDDDAAAAMYAHLIAVNDSLARLNDAVLLESWREALGRVLALPGIHGLVAGRSARLLLDAGALDADQVAAHWSSALSRAADASAGAGWVEGFLRDAGTLLVHDPKLWTILDGWLSGLASDAFGLVLPLLRRTVATFSAPERRRLGERARSARGGGDISGAVAAGAADEAESFDHERARAVLPTIALLLGLDDVSEKGA